MKRIINGHGNKPMMVSVLLMVAVLFFVQMKGEKERMSEQHSWYKQAGELNPLTEAEERVIVHKGTEPPFTGKYVNHKAEGYYTCRRCDAPLYLSDSKFDSRCGWPSFDGEIRGAVERKRDEDGRRTEILCQSCGGHLGHVFSGEGFTAKNIRHCVNSVSLDFVPADKTARAIFASGCFWGTEYHLQKTRGVLETSVGYTGGHVENPTYKQVCSGRTGHAEAVEVIYDPKKTSFEVLVRLFFETHDPTHVNRQGPDIGEQYRSKIYYVNEEQKVTAQRLIDQLEAKGYDVATRLTAAADFWKGEEYHQDYYGKKSGTPYCHIYTKRF